MGASFFVFEEGEEGEKGKEKRQKQKTERRTALLSVAVKLEESLTAMAFRYTSGTLPPTPRSNGHELLLAAKLSLTHLSAGPPPSGLPPVK